MAQHQGVFGKLAVAGAVFCAILEVGYLLTTSPPYDALGYLIGRDFVSTWVGAKSALTGGPALWFDFESYNVHLRAIFRPDFPPHNWSYPPHLLLLTWPLGFLGYIPAYVVWCLGGMALFVFVAMDRERRPGSLPLLAASPAAAMNAFAGQIGFIAAAMMIGGLKHLDRRPIVAGIWFGLLTVKPQLGILVPLMLILTRRWITVVAAAVTAAVMGAGAAWWFGWSIWPDYVRLALPFQRYVMQEGTGIFTYMMPTAFMNARIAHWPIEYAWASQALMSCFAVAAVCWTFWRRRDPVLSSAVFITASFLVTPYVFNYDMVMFGWVILLLSDRGGTPLDLSLAIAVWALPIAAVLLGLAGLPVSSLVLAGFAARLLWRLKEADQSFQTAVQSGESGDARCNLNAPPPELAGHYTRRTEG